MLTQNRYKMNIAWPPNQQNLLGRKRRWTNSGLHNVPAYKKIFLYNPLQLSPDWSDKQNNIETFTTWSDNETKITSFIF